MIRTARSLSLLLKPRVADGDGDGDGRPLPPSLPVEFCFRRGLDPLCPGEADAVVLAGMGAQTMLEILLGPPSSTPDAVTPPLPLPVDRVRTARVFLQPTNSRPQHMVMLYERMQGSGDWSLEGETIACSGGRWYVNSLFERRRRRDGDGDGDDDLGGGESSSSSPPGGGDSFRFPGHFLVRVASADGGGAYDSYVRHHLRWLREDWERPKYLLDDEDRRWLEYMSSAEENDKWKGLASWFGG